MNKTKINYHKNSCYYADILKNNEWFIFLDSCFDKGSEGRYCILSCDPVIKIISKKNNIIVEKDGIKSSYKEDPLTVIKKYYKYSNIQHSSDLPFNSGFMGYFGYDAFNYTDSYIDGRFPDIAVGLYEWAIVIDHVEKSAWLTYEKMNSFIKKIIDIVNLDIKIKVKKLDYSFSNLNQLTSKDQYIKDVKKIKKYISEGDCYQVNYSQNFEVDFIGDTWSLYKDIRNKNPAPYSSFFKFGENSIISSSPERFISVKDNIVETKPIKGTLKRLQDKIKDNKQKDILQNDEKNLSENLMIVDLLRNDLSKCCDLNSVKVEKLFDIETYASVHHMVSTIKGKLNNKTKSIDILKACFPGGSITGAPKIRSMEIISELEKRPRGVYCGSIGYLDKNNNMDTNICIRTIMINNGKLNFAAGGGIVYDSNPEDEYIESLEKVSIFLKFFSKGSFTW